MILYNYIIIKENTINIAKSALKIAKNAIIVYEIRNKLKRGRYNYG